ncbi:FMN-binding protein [Marinisporobacter balticus]|uniref:4Fe-4S binding protein n=1 Tax=Marinisporobacter balticus TaxID=2018667 RepID=A0A4R2K783_9FIRM|nr:FMN-binding protein [Marinisporobacter balticus]TCO67737.1 4Fe-4S binding protein [Marinisporobacter balticus]
MKKIQKYRLGVQILCLVLTIAGFFADFRGTMLVIIGLMLLSGVFYCGWVCPFGFMQDLFSKLGSLLCIKKRKMPIAIQKVLVFSRYILLGLVFLIGSDFIFSIMSFDPRVNFEKLLLGNMVAISFIGILCFFVLIALFFERPFCNYFCFEGAKYGLMSYFRLFTITRDKSLCVNCKKCDKACPMNIEVSKCNNLRALQCINCFQCVSSCPVKGSLHYGKTNMKKREKKRYLAMLTSVLVLIGAFLVYNIYNGDNPLNIKNKHHAEANVDKNTMIEPLPSTSDEITVITDKCVENLGDGSGIADGVYTGKGEGFKGTITVQVTVNNEQIIAVEVIENRDDKKWFNRANDVIPDSIVDSQSTDANVVSGATYSSRGIIDGVKDALKNQNR